MARKLLRKLRVCYPVHLRERHEPPVSRVHCGIEMNSAVKTCEHILIAGPCIYSGRYIFEIHDGDACDGCENARAIGEQILAKELRLA